MEPPTASYYPALHAQTCGRWAYGNIGPGGRIHENALLLSCGVRITSCLPLSQDVFRYLVMIVAYGRVLTSYGFFSTRHQYYVCFPFPAAATNLFLMTALMSIADVSKTGALASAWNNRRRTLSRVLSRGRNAPEQACLTSLPSTMARTGLSITRN